MTCTVTWVLLLAVSMLTTFIVVLSAKNVPREMSATIVT